MDVSSAQLLKLLGSGVLPPGVNAAPRSSVEQASFADLLNRARQGTLGSARPITVSDDIGVTLTDDQQARLSLAADQLETAGVRVAMVSIDGQKLILDVTQREITGIAPADGPVPNIDGAIDLGDLRPPPELTLPGATPVAAEQIKPTGSTLTPPSSLPQSPTLLHLLASMTKTG